MGLFVPRVMRIYLGSQSQLFLKGMEFLNREELTRYLRASTGVCITGTCSRFF